MEKEIKVRKKRFAAFWVAVLMVCGMVLPTAVSAEDYKITISQNGEVSGLQIDDILYQGDTILYEKSETSEPSEPAVKFNVTYYDHMNQVIGNAIEVSRGQVYAVDSYTSKPDVATFQGWRVGTVYASSGILETVTLYAQISYPITYVGVENATHTNDDEYTYGSTVQLEDASRPGYTFGGWFTDQTYETQIPEITENTAGALTLYAKFTANAYTITFNTDGGSAIAPITQDYGTSVTAPAAPTKTGYTFAGWNEEFPETMPAENLTLTAKWTANQYTITFDTNGGSVIAPITQDYGTAITAPGDPTMENYYFVSWDNQIPATMPAEDITITAMWTPKVIDAGSTWYLEAGKEYKLGTAKTVDGDSSTYAHGAVFYVAQSGEYTFS